MTDWAVNWVEQSQIYRELLTKYQQYAAQSQPVTVFSFTIPTQAMWEDAYVAQTGEVPPILPGSKLRWMDLKNGTIKPYSTVWMNGNGNTLIDPVVRPMMDSSQPWGAIRLLGKLGLWETVESQYSGGYYPVTSDVFIVSVGMPQDMTTMIDKGLVSLFLHFRDSRAAQLVNTVGVAMYYSVSRAGATPTNASSGPSGMQIVGANRMHGYSMLFNTTTEKIGSALSQLPGGMSSYFLGTDTLVPNTLRHQLAIDSGNGTTDVRNMLGLASVAEHNIPAATSAYLYGVFNADAGYLEAFEYV